jgi:RHS repeat-associated protein
LSPQRAFARQIESRADFTIRGLEPKLKTFGELQKDCVFVDPSARSIGEFDASATDWNCEIPLHIFVRENFQIDIEGNLDAAGNQTKHGIVGQTATYGDRGQVTKFGAAAQYYFGNGNTDRVTAQSIDYVSSALGIMQRISASATYNFTRTSTGALLSLRGSSPHYYTADHLGSITGMFSSTGAWEGGYSYTPYGEARFTATGSAVTANTLRYIGGLHDGSGLYKLGARYYDTSTGRFTQMDPSGQEPHPYGYAACNPIGNTDPTGLSCGAAITDLIINSITFAIAVGALVGLAVATPAGPLAFAVINSVGAGAVIDIAFSIWGAGRSVESIRNECK